MSVKALEWASKHPGLTRLEKTILKEIANRYNDQKGRAWPSQNRIARDTGYHRSSVNRGLKALEEKGLLVRLNAFDGDSGARMSNRYFLPTFEPERVPESKRPIVVESNWDPHGAFISEESQHASLKHPRQDGIHDVAQTLLKNLD